MISSSCANTPSQAGRSPLLLIGLVAGFLGIVTFLPRAVLSGAGVVGTGARPSADKALAPFDERFAAFTQAERLMQSGTKQDAEAAGRLMDNMATTPLFVSEGDSVGDSPSEASFSSSILIAKLARQFDAAAARAVMASGARPTAMDAANALQWTQRARRIADALMLSEHPSYSALKIAHYLDAIAGKREAAVLRACGNVAQAATTERQNTSLKQVWHGEILPILERMEPQRAENERAAINANPQRRVLNEAEWAAHIDYLVQLYQKERVFTSQS